MKYAPAVTLSIATLSFALLLPASAQTSSQNGNMQGQNNYNAQSQNGASNWGPNGYTPARGRREAAQMVPARAALTHTLDADKTRPGYQFRATLSKTVRLDNGTVLPSGTMLLGRVATDDMNVAGTSKLALRFTQADLKDGQVIPIRATIVGVYRPEGTNAEGYPIAAGDEVSNHWTDKTLAVDELNVMSGVDLHSKISSGNSGVFVSTKNNDVKLSSGSEIALAIAPRNASQQAMNHNGRM